MKTKVFVLVAAFAMIFLSGNAQEKEKRFGVELSGGLSIATNELGGTNLDPGFGFEGILHYRFMQHTGVYAGWGWNQFSADESFAGPEMDFEETGYVLGLQFKHPIKNSSLSYFLRAGGLYNHIELENRDGEIIGDTGHGFGWQVAGGLDIDLGSNWSLTPGVRFNSLSGDIEMESNTEKLNLNYLNIRVGILKKF